MSFHRTLNAREQKLLPQQLDLERQRINIQIIVYPFNSRAFILVLIIPDWYLPKTAKTRSDRDFEMSLCYTPKAFSCL